MDAAFRSFPPVVPDSVALPLLNRELSWLDFNARVLHEALDERNPLLERLKFVAIFSSNLDEFYMVRVGGLRRRVALGVASPADDPPTDLLGRVDERVRDLIGRQRRCLDEQLLPQLAARGIQLLRVHELSGAERQQVSAFFEAEVYPVLTPLVVDPAHPFPYISSLSISLAVQLRDPLSGAERLARVKVPRSLPRWVPTGRPHRFVPLEEVVGANLGALFEGMDVVGCYAFRLTRYSDLELDFASADGTESLLAVVERQVFERRFGEVVRLEVQDGMPQGVCDLLVEELNYEGGALTLPLTARDVFATDGLLDLGGLLPLASLDVPELRDPPFVPVVPAELRDAGRSIFDVIREKDLLAHHPFESFGATVERFLEQAAADEHVLAIKLALYRTSGDTAIIRALVEAAQRGKQVAVIVELKARFDEENNIQWARTLEDYGVHLSYGAPHLKTHAKIALVVRRAPDGIRRYVHIGSGNYNSRTARLYTDVGLFTCNAAIGADASDLFNSLTGYSRRADYRRLLVAPAALRTRLVELIDREAAHAAAGRPARVIAKMNALVDPGVIDALYRASRAGARIDLIVRGICCLHPGLPGTSENIRVVSIVGRFLEHSRIWAFANGGAEEFYLGSADWMPRNFERRVEVVVPVDSPDLHGRIRAALQIYLDDNRQAWELGADGGWRQRSPGAELVRASQERLLAEPAVTLAPAVAAQGGLPGAPARGQTAVAGSGAATRAAFPGS